MFENPCDPSPCSNGVCRSTENGKDYWFVIWVFCFFLLKILGAIVIVVLKVINVTRRLINARAIHVPKKLLCALIQSLGPIVFVQLVNCIVKISTLVVLMICVTKSDHVKTTESVFHHRVVTSANVPLDGRARIVPSGLIPVMVRISRLELCS